MKYDRNNEPCSPIEDVHNMLTESLRLAPAHSIQTFVCQRKQNLLPGSASGLVFWYNFSILKNTRRIVVVKREDCEEQSFFSF